MITKEEYAEIVASLDSFPHFSKSLGLDPNSLLVEGLQEKTSLYVSESQRAFVNAFVSWIFLKHEEKTVIWMTPYGGRAGYVNHRILDAIMDYPKSIQEFIPKVEKNWSNYTIGNSYLHICAPTENAVRGRGCNYIIMDNVPLSKHHGIYQYIVPAMYARSGAIITIADWER